MFEPFLRKEWLVKTNSSSSTPYLFKFISSTIDLTCSVLFTDTKSIWSEELTGQQIARRWRESNPKAPPPFITREDEDEWRASILELLKKAHTIGGVNAFTFEVVHTGFSDMAFLLQGTSLAWKWETCFVGYKLSADIISQQLVLPLISANYLLFTSAESVRDMTDIDVEKAIDKIGRMARRSVGAHIQNALSNPRVSTVIRRTAAVFNSPHELPGIIFAAEEPDLQVPDAALSKPAEDDSMSAGYRHDSQPLRDVKMKLKHPLAKADSATEESESDGLLAPPAIHSQSQASHNISPRPLVSLKSLPTDSDTAGGIRSRSPLAKESDLTPTLAKTFEQNGGTDSDSDSTPPKKAQASPSDSDSEAERRARVARLKSNARESGTGQGTAKSGVRQPIKRGGKRF